METVETPDTARWARFGDRPSQVLHPDTADQLLTLWRDRHPGQFGSLLAEILTGGGQRFSPARVKS